MTPGPLQLPAAPAPTSTTSSARRRAYCRNRDHFATIRTASLVSVAILPRPGGPKLSKSINDFLPVTHE